MRTFHTVTKTVTEYASCTCDFCDKEMDPFGRSNRVEISAQRGKSDPEGFFGERFGDVGTHPDERVDADPQLDCCLACFESKVIPALRAAGLPERVQWRWWSY
jgi:hypothetical protein